MNEWMNIYTHTRASIQMYVYVSVCARSSYNKSIKHVSSYNRMCACVCVSVCVHLRVTSVKVNVNLTWMAFFVSSKWRRDLTVGSTLRNLSSKRPNAFSQPCRPFSKLSQCSANCCSLSLLCSRLCTRSCQSRFSAEFACSINWRLRASAWRIRDCACWFTSERSLFWLCNDVGDNNSSDNNNNHNNHVTVILQ